MKLWALQNLLALAKYAAYKCLVLKLAKKFGVPNFLQSPHEALHGQIYLQQSVLHKTTIFCSSCVAPFILLSPFPPHLNDKPWQITWVNYCIAFSSLSRMKGQLLSQGLMLITEHIIIIIIQNKSIQCQTACQNMSVQVCTNKSYAVSQEVWLPNELFDMLLRRISEHILPQRIMQSRGEWFSLKKKTVISCKWCPKSQVLLMKN